MNLETISEILFTVIAFITLYEYCEWYIKHPEDFENPNKK
jgi:hypothetical protein